MSSIETTSSVRDLFTFDVKEVARHAVQRSAELPAPWLTDLLSQCEYGVTPEGGRCQLRAETAGHGIRIRGRVQFQADTECGVCLAPVHLRFDVEIDTFMAPRTAETASAEEYTIDDLDCETYEGDTLSLSELVSDSILLELPMTPRCEGPCQKIPGLVTHDELQNNNPVDPRLTALADIRLSKES